MLPPSNSSAQAFPSRFSAPSSQSGEQLYSKPSASPSFQSGAQVHFQSSIPLLSQSSISSQPLVPPPPHVHNVQVSQLNANAPYFAPQSSICDVFPLDFKPDVHRPFVAHTSCNLLPPNVCSSSAHQSHRGPISTPLIASTPAAHRDDVAALSRAVSALYLPHAEIDKFDGNPLNYATFMSAFTARVQSQSINFGE